MRPNNHPSDWFEELYSGANEQSEHIPWAKLKVDPFLYAYLSQSPTHTGKALVIGSGLGDDAKSIADAGYETYAIDISQSAIDWSKKRFPQTNIHFEVQDIFKLPKRYIESFDFVFESLTIQSLPIAYRPDIIEAIKSTLAPKGKLLVVAHGKNEGETFAGPPWPLLRNELGLFKIHGLTELEFNINEETSLLSSLKFRALYQQQG